TSRSVCPTRRRDCAAYAKYSDQRRPGKNSSGSAAHLELHSRTRKCSCSHLCHISQQARENCLRSYVRPGRNTYTQLPGEGLHHPCCAERLRQSQQTAPHSFDE